MKYPVFLTGLLFSTYLLVLSNHSVCTARKIYSFLTTRKAKSKNLTIEDEYVNFYLNDPFHFYGWKMMRTWYVRDRRDDDVKKYCEKAHKRAGYGVVKVVLVFMKARFLSFENPEYETRHVDTVTYGVEGEVDQTKDANYYYLNEGNLWYIQDGLRPGCVYYLTLWNRTIKEFRLSKHVCGLPKE